MTDWGRSYLEIQVSLAYPRPIHCSNSFLRPRENPLVSRPVVKTRPLTSNYRQEIWRTSTAMPTRTGIYWNYQKDMTVWTTLLKEDQKVIMEMDNIYDTVFTGAYNVTITALYYNDAYAISPTPADIILPLSSLSGANNESSVVSCKEPFHLYHPRLLSQKKVNQSMNEFLPSQDTLQYSSLKAATMLEI